MTRLRFLGTGNAFHTDGRGSQAIWFETGDLSFIVDVGPTALAAIERLGLDPSRLDGCFITHLHGDHIAGWPFLLLHFAYLSQRTHPFYLFVPEGGRARLEALTEACYASLLGPEKQSYDLVSTDLPIAAARNLRGLGDITFDTVPMDHDPSSIGYRLHVEGCTIGVSGDTRWCPALEELARGCQTLIMECTTLERSPAAHVSLAELRERVEHLDCERIVLVHLDNRVAAHLQADPLERVMAATDGLVLEL